MSVLSRRPHRGSARILALTLALAAGLAAESQAGWPRARRARLVPTSAPRVAGVAPSPMLGTFYPSHDVDVVANFTTGGGYSPLGTYGDTAASLYGPLSAFRATAAPVQMYQRGYNGSFRPELGTGFSTPNQPALSPVVYPTRANAVGGARRMTTPPQWDNAINWIDLN